MLLNILSLGVVRGLIGQAIGMAVGYLLVTLIRPAQGLGPAAPGGPPALPPPHGLSSELAWLVAAIFGLIGFLLGAGVFNDWIKWASGKKTPLRHGPPEHRPAWTRYFSVDYNHKVIGIQYTVTGVIVLLVGGILAIIFRLELVFPGMQFLTENQFNTLFSAHGIIMIASILLGVGGMINYLVPLMIGASDMAFPRLNAFSYWVAIPGAVFILLGIFLGGWDTGWVAYPPLSAVTPPVGVLLFLFGFYIIGFSSIAGAINVLVTVATMRAPGMGLFRMPIFVWAAVATSIIQVTATQTVAVALLMVITQRVLGMGFFDPAGGGDPILYQHLFWFYSHPAVYIFVLPGLGVISELLPVFSRKPLFGYRWIALSSLAIALIGFLVWAHHMFVSGMDDALRVPFMFSTMFVAIPTGVKFFSWVGTMWQGKLSFPTPMLFVLGAISVFLIGGLSGPILGTIPTDMPLHDTYWVVGHFHATMFGGFVFPFFAAMYYWFPKVTGRMYNEALGKLHFWLMTPGFWLMSLGQMRAGLLGMRRRVIDYDPALGIDFTHFLITLSAFIIGWSVLIMVYNLVSSARSAELAEANPWRSRSPEWQVASPMPEMNYDRPLVVVGSPYDYGLPGSTYVVSMYPAGAGD
ncbi:MAG: cbb3-type cytochrome c oxidase subunit I [Chloroflexi bacterium]|nr:cbb3-type cytochrome c oxidase subunit I [Chloroflexota bacterium]MCI0580124.1 cbb3-type cytochrome c oxidase subunit I [Chloroflexota bacterium]MCI0649300.1 cbb3-type cytochrome c oxidase subunit I [Chloroflexota bacterium]MCI0725967.1 cbb3-type cytochrome c oxidase subunit I [Chloroflexota bacterium]